VFEPLLYRREVYRVMPGSLPQSSLGESPALGIAGRGGGAEEL
jgi:hypothetical protein